MKFTLEDMMRNSFAMVTGDGEYDRLCRRFRMAGFTDMPRKHMGLYPMTLFKGGISSYDACGLTHFTLVNMARTMGLDHITIFEADAYPMKGCREALGRFLEPGVPDDAHEVIFGNLHFIRDCRLGHGEHSLRDITPDGRFGRITRHLWGAHAVTVFSGGYDTWLRSWIESRRHLAADWFNELTPKCYATTRSFFIQVKYVLEHRDKMTDRQWLCDFPPIGSV